MQMNEDSRRRVLGELQRIHREIANCSHCEALRGQYARLSILLPPDPIEVQRGEQLMRYIFDPPKEYWDLVEYQIKQLLPAETPDGL